MIEITAEIRAFIDKAAAGVELAEDECWNRFPSRTGREKRRMIFIGFPIVMSFLIVKSPLPLIHL